MRRSVMDSMIAGPYLAVNSIDLRSDFYTKGQYTCTQSPAAVGRDARAPLVFHLWSTLDVSM